MTAPTALALLLFACCAPASADSPIENANDLHEAGGGGPGSPTAAPAKVLPGQALTGASPVLENLPAPATSPRRPPSAPSAERAAAPGAAEEEHAAGAVSQRASARRKAADRAREMARSLKPSAAPAVKESLPAAKEAREATEAAGRALLLAASGPYRAAVTDAGLKLGRDPSGAQRLERADGTPATDSDLRRLSERIAGEPKALVRRPDFFGVVPREDYAALKADLAMRPDRPQYRDMESSRPEGRDIVWSRSCDKVEGDCNPAAAESHYGKGTEVSPETLRGVWRDIESELDREQKAAPDAGEAARRLSARRVDAGLFGRLLEGLRAMAPGWFGLGSAPAGGVLAVSAGGDDVGIGAPARAGTGGTSSALRSSGAGRPLREQGPSARHDPTIFIAAGAMLVFFGIWRASRAGERRRS